MVATAAIGRKLAALKFEFGRDAAQKKLECLRQLSSSSLKSAAEVVSLHETLCFMRAWPDDGDVARQVEAMLAGFRERRDFQRHASALADTGIAGARITFSFFAATALWLAGKWPEQLRIDWGSFEKAEVLERYLSLLISSSETSALDSYDMGLSEWIERLKGPREGDATFVIKRLAKVTCDDALFERIYEEFDIPVILLPGPDTPSRTCARHASSPVVFQSQPLDHSRPIVVDEVKRPPHSLELLARGDADALIDLARSAMATRSRDLDAFAYANHDDVSLIDDQDGLQFALIGMLPQRRFLLETQYGFLVLRNGIPVSYGSIVSLFGSAEVAYTVFDTFRGGESAHLYARTLALAANVFECDTFVISPYQLGEDNDDALASGAWWFYQKLGYRPRDSKLLRRMKQELAEMKRRPGYRSNKATLKMLAQGNIYLDLSQQRDDVLGILELANIGLKIADFLASTCGSDREAGLRKIAADVAAAFEIDDLGSWSKLERAAWLHWAPLLALLPEAADWPQDDKRAVALLVRAKAGRRELEYLRQFNRLHVLRVAIEKLARDG